MKREIESKQEVEDMRTLHGVGEVLDGLGSDAERSTLLNEDLGQSVWGRHYACCVHG